MRRGIRDRGAVFAVFDAARAAADRSGEWRNWNYLTIQVQLAVERYQFEGVAACPIAPDSPSADTGGGRACDGMGQGQRPDPGPNSRDPVLELGLVALGRSSAAGPEYSSRFQTNPPARSWRASMTPWQEALFPVSESTRKRPLRRICPRNSAQAEFRMNKNE